MIRLFLSTLMLILFCSNTSHAFVRNYSNLENMWKSESSTAYISGKTTLEDGTVIINSFIVSFDKTSGCKPEFGVSFLEGFEYGELRDNKFIKKGFLKLYIDNEILYDGPVVNLMYTKGTEFGAIISPETLSRLYNGKILRIEIVNKMDILFNLNNAKVHIDKAKNDCGVITNDDSFFEVFGDLYFKGSLVGFFLLLYSISVSAISWRQREDMPHLTSGAERTFLAILFCGLSFPVLIWSLIYSIGHISFLKGLIVWVVSSCISTASVYLLGYRMIPGIHVMLSWLAMVVGLYLTIKTHPF